MHLNHIRHCISIVTLLIAINSLAAAQPAFASDKATIQLKWLHDFQYAGYYAALEKGFYREAGLDVTIREGGPTADVEKDVASGRADFGVGTSALLINRYKGQDFIVLGQIFQHSPAVLLTMRKSGIHSVSDMLGKRFMYSNQLGDMIALLKKSGINDNSIKKIPHSGDPHDLINGKADVMLAYRFNEPFVMEQSGEPYLTFSPLTAGIDFYGDNFFTTDRLVAKRPAFIEAFRKATLQGWAYALENKTEIAKLIAAKYPSGKSLEWLLFEAGQMEDLIQPKFVELGYQSASRWQSIAETFIDLGMLPKGFDPAPVIYVPKTLEDNRPLIITALVSVTIIIFLAWLVLTFSRLNRKLKEQIEEREQAEAELRKLSRAVEQSPVTIVITDVHGTIEFVNPMFTKLTGYTAEEAIGQNPRILKSVNTSTDTYEELWSTITAGNTWEGEFYNKSKDGSLFWERAAISPLRDANGTITHYLAVKENVTENKSIMEQLVAAKEQAEAGTRAKSDFLATMSHEIRTPMNGVIGMTGLLLDTELDKEQREYAEIVHRSGDNLLGLINDILDFSKIESGKLDLEILDFDLRRILDDTTLMFAHRATEAGLDLTCHIEPSVPLCLKGDPGRVRQIIINLVGNALKFSHQGGVALTVSLVREQDGIATVKFEVHDTGIGMPASRLAAVFEPFTQASGSTARKYGGTGLGLAICKQLAELMGGEIGVTSEEGKGSTFWFTSRFEKQTEQTSDVLTTAQKSTLSPRVALTINNRNARILLAEDNIINQKVAQNILKKLGYTADVVADGGEAVQALEMIDYDLVLMDCMMPEMNGFEATAMIRNTASKVLNHNIPIIAMTANAMKGDHEKCIEAGMDDYMSKPVKKTELSVMLAKWLTR